MKMKKLIIIILSVLFGHTAKGQIKGNIDVDYSYGFSSAMGDFASRNINSSSSGFATWGFSRALTIGYELPNKKFSILLRTQTNSNILDAENYATALREELGGYWNVISGAYAQTGWYLGVNLPYTITPTAQLGLQIFGGRVLAGTPAVSVYEIGSEYWDVVIPNYSRSFGYQVGVEFKKRLYSTISITSNLDLIGTQMEFTNTKSYTVMGNIFNRTYTQPMNAINFRLGVALDVL